MRVINSRQNSLIQTFRNLAKDAEMRREKGCFLCHGYKTLTEAVRSSAEIQTVLWKEKRKNGFPAFQEEYVLPSDLFDYVSPMKNSPGPLFTVKIRQNDYNSPVFGGVLVLEGVQDPGNVGTILRTADAFCIDTVILLDGCADLYSPKTVRASMGAIFRQNVLRLSTAELVDFCANYSLRLFGAALSDSASDLRTTDLSHAAVAIGSEGKGLSSELRKLCDQEVIIPMSGAAESLNAAIAASIIMWEMYR